MKSILFTVVISLISVKSFSQDWVFICENSFGAKTYVQSRYVKKETLSGISFITIWVKSISPRMTIKGVDKVYKNTATLILYMINCQDKKMQTDKMIIYSSTGEMLQSLTDIGGSWQYVVPDSIGESIVEYVCKTFNQ